jgi:hypothetical protein
MKSVRFDAQTRIASPLGPLTLAATARGLALVWFDGQAHRSESVDAPELPDHPHLALAAQELARYWQQPRAAFTVPLDPQGTLGTGLGLSLSNGTPGLIPPTDYVTRTGEELTIDGVRAEYPDGFGLARSSNTTPVVVLRFEGDNAAALVRIQEAFRRAILAVAPHVTLPF